VIRTGDPAEAAVCQAWEGERRCFCVLRSLPGNPSSKGKCRRTKAAAALFLRIIQVQVLVANWDLIFSHQKDISYPS